MVWGRARRGESYWLPGFVRHLELAGLVSGQPDHTGAVLDSYFALEELFLHLHTISAFKNKGSPAATLTKWQRYKLDYTR